MDDDFNFYLASKQISQEPAQKIVNPDGNITTAILKGLVCTLLETAYIYYDTQAWGASRKCWCAFKISNSKGDIKNSIHYAKGLRFQKELGLVGAYFVCLSAHFKLSFSLIFFLLSNINLAKAPTNPPATIPMILTKPPYTPQKSLN